MLMLRGQGGQVELYPKATDYYILYIVIYKHIVYYIFITLLHDTRRLSTG